MSIYDKLPKGLEINPLDMAELVGALNKAEALLCENGEYEAAEKLAYLSSDFSQHLEDNA